MASIVDRRLGICSQIYLSWAKSLGAAHWVAQWARWKTAGDLVKPAGCNSKERQLTFFNTILFGLAIVLDLTRDALNALVIVVLGSGACLGLCAFYGNTD
jgi:hypothetical protein